MSKSNGIVIYDGKSLLDNKTPIVAIITGFSRKSKNPKTGNTLQSWILNKNINPFTAYIQCKDKSICGNCFMRKIKSCYVSKAHAPFNVYKAYKNNKYIDLSIMNVYNFYNKTIRVGSYGEPTSIPIEKWEEIFAHNSGMLGYTHNWQHCDQRWNKYLMASVETISQQKLANKMGWRTFRVRTSNSSVLQNEMVCPASVEGGHKTTCQKCLSCCGNSSKMKKNVVIEIHGRSKNKFTQIMKLRVAKKKYSHLI